MIRWLMTLTALGCGRSDGAPDASAKPEAPCEEQVWFMDQDADGAESISHLIETSLDSVCVRQVDLEEFNLCTERAHLLDVESGVLSPNKRSEAVSDRRGRCTLASSLELSLRLRLGLQRLGGRRHSGPLLVQQGHKPLLVAQLEVEHIEMVAFLEELVQQFQL